MKRATQRLLDGQSQTWSSKSCFLTKKKKRWSASGLTRSQACRANKGEREEVLLVLKGDQRALEQALQRHVRLAGARRHAQLRQQRSMPL